MLISRMGSHKSMCPRWKWLFREEFRQSSWRSWRPVPCGISRKENRFAFALQEHWPSFCGRRQRAKRVTRVKRVGLQRRFKVLGILGPGKQWRRDKKRQGEMREEEDADVCGNLGSPTRFRNCEYKTRANQKLRIRHPRIRNCESETEDQKPAHQKLARIKLRIRTRARARARARVRNSAAVTAAHVKQTCSNVGGNSMEGGTCSNERTWGGVR